MPPTNALPSGACPPPPMNRAADQTPPGPNPCSAGGCTKRPVTIVVTPSCAQVSQSQTRHKTLEPHWDQLFAFPMAGSAWSTRVLSVAVYDDDGVFSGADFLGKVVLDLMEVEIRGESYCGMQGIGCRL